MDHNLKFKPGQAVTFATTTAANGGDVAEITGNRTVGLAAAASVKAIGTYAHDVAIGDNVVVHIAGPIDTFVASAAIPAGSEIEAAGAGRVRVRTTGRSLGLALTAATAAGDIVQALRV